eukprot:UN18195
MQFDTTLSTLSSRRKIRNAPSFQGGLLKIHLHGNSWMGHHEIFVSMYYYNYSFSEISRNVPGKLLETVFSQ